jgi:hypothetical protein
MDEVERSGFDATDDIVHLFVGGSELHGAKVGATDDLDIYGIFVEKPVIALGLTPRDHFVWSTASDKQRNGPDDVDVTLYSLRRWAALAAKGNATALHFVFADATAVSDASMAICAGTQISVPREAFGGAVSGLCRQSETTNHRREG